MRIVVKNISPYDGEYHLDSEQAFNAREWRWVKQISGYMPTTIDDGMAGDDPDLYVAFAVVAMCRNGKIKRDEGLAVAETIAEAPFDGSTLQVLGDPAEDDADPPALTSKPDEPSPSGLLENPTSSGEPSRNDSAPSDATPSPTTATRLVTSSA